MSDDMLPACQETVRWNGRLWMVHRLEDRAVHLRGAVTGEMRELELREWFGGVEAGLIERRARPEAVIKGTPRRRAWMRWQDTDWQVTVIKDGIIHIINPATQEGSAISVADWRAGCFEGTVEMTDGLHQELPERKRALLTAAVEHMPKSMQKAADWQGVYFEAWRDPEGFYARHFPNLPESERILVRTMHKPKVKAFFRDVERATGVAPPGFSTFHKWHSVVSKAGGDVRAAIPRHDLQGPHERYMGARVEEWLNEEIDRVWLTLRQNRKTRVHEALDERVTKWNDEHPDHPIECPSKGHVARYIREEVDRYVACHRRHGRKAAEQRFNQVQRGIVTTRILERVEVDNTLIKIRVKHDQTGTVLGYPWVTSALDHYSRMPLSMHVNFENQSLSSCFQSLRSAMSPKGFLTKLVPELDYDYPAGVPEAFYFDRGPDFDSDHVRRVGLCLHIRMDYEPVACPNYKGALERFWRTFKDDVGRGQPGYVVKNVDGEIIAGVDDDGEVYLTFSEFVRRCWHWASMVYAKRPHRGIDNQLPLVRWQTSEAVTAPRALRKRDDLNILLTRVEECALTREGVTFSGLTWIGDPKAPGGEVLERIMRDPAFQDGMKVKVRIDDNDVSKAWVVNPFTLREEPLRPKLLEYMTGLSLYAHDRILKNMAKLRKGGHDSRALAAGRRKQVALAEDLLSGKTKGSGARLGKVAKFMGIGQRAPAGDDLGDVLPDPRVEVASVATPTLAPAADPAPLTEDVVTGATTAVRRRSVRNH